MVPFFGRPAWTTPIIAEIAMKYRVPIVPAFAGGCRTTVTTWRSPRCSCWRANRTRSQCSQNTAMLTGLIEEAVRRDPAQWFWVHRRWRD